jgi:hypothetical protein
MANTITAPGATEKAKDTATTNTIITQLRALEQLTLSEEQLARVRLAQARTDEVRRELREKADSADRRTRRIVEELRELGALPDVVTPAIGRMLALVKTAVEQTTPIDEALLSDLTLEHQLLDRARYVRVLAQRAELPSVRQLADDLISAHTAAVDWLTQVLAEEALGGPAALTPTPFQRVAGGVVQAVVLPTRFAARQVNRAVGTVYRTRGQAREVADELAERAGRVGAGVRDVGAAGRDAALQEAERVARREGGEGVAGAVREARADTGVLSAEELPIRGYDEMPASRAISAIRELTEPEEINAVTAYEERNKNRAGVISAAQARYAEITKERT